MKLLTLKELEQEPNQYGELVQVLEEDGVICFPAESNYRLGSSAMSHRAVSSLMAAKRRSAHAPALVFLSGGQMLDTVAAEVPDLARKMADAFWPGPLTLLVQPSDAFPAKVRKALTKATGRVGVRVPGHDVARRIVEAFGHPMLVSSANLAKKSGATSPAQVRKNFGRQVEAMVDSGDLPTAEPSTLVEVTGDEFVIKRLGAIDEQTIQKVAGVNGR